MVKDSLCLLVTGTALYIETFLFDKFVILQSTDYVKEDVIFPTSTTKKSSLFSVP